MNNEIFDNKFNQVKKALVDSKYCYTSKALYNFYLKISSICYAINKLDDINEIYPQKILLRSLLELYLVSYYIWFSNYLNKDDNCGIEYYQTYSNSELYKQYGYQQKIDNIKKNKKKNVSGLKYIQDSSQYLTTITESEYQNVMKIGNNFSIDNILSFLINKVPNKKTSKLLHKTMLTILNQYNTLSSYVHGGPFAEKQVNQIIKGIIVEKYNCKWWSKLVLNEIKSQIILFLCLTDKKFFLIVEDEKKNKLNNSAQQGV